MALHLRLQMYLKARNTNVSRFAKELGLSQSGLSRVVKGDTMPSYRVLDALGRTGINLNWLLLGEGSMMRSPSPSTEAISTLPEVQHLKKQITLLEDQLQDKERLIQLLYERLE